VRPPVAGGLPGKLVLTQEVRKALVQTTYLITSLESDFGGRCFQLAKVSKEDVGNGEVRVGVADTYNVRLSGNESSCDCADFTFRGYERPCKHIVCLQLLGQLGKLDAPVMACEPLPMIQTAEAI
jgi:hypothetical protein